MPTVLPKADFKLELTQGKVAPAIKAAGGKTTEMYMVHPDQINVLDDFNVRITGTPAYIEGIDELRDNIIVNGFDRDKPLTVYVGLADGGENALFLTDGHRRLEAVRAAIAAGHTIEAVPVLVKPTGTSMEDLTVAMAKTGTPLAPYELGTLIKRLQGFGLDTTTIAKRIGKSNHYVNDLLLVHGAPTKIRNLIVTGKITTSQAIKEIRADRSGAEAKLTSRVENAEAAGKTKATNRDSAPMTGRPAGKPAARKSKTDEIVSKELHVKGKLGDKAALDKFAPFFGIEGGDWYRLTETEGEVELVAAVDFFIRYETRRPKTPVDIAKEAADL